MHVLIAEDDAVTRLTLSAALKGMGHEVTVSADGAEAWADFITKPVDLEEVRARLKVAERILGLRQHMQQLEGLLPICQYCKRIRGGDESWEPIERYVENRSEAQFSHGICPDCYKKHVEP